MQRLYPNLKALMAIYAFNPMFAVHLSVLNTTTELGQKFAKGLDWIFTETEQKIVILERIINAPEKSGQHPGKYVDELMTELGLPWVTFVNTKSDNVRQGTNDQAWVASIPQDLEPGMTFEYEGIKMVAVHNCGNDYLSAVPAKCVLYRDPGTHEALVASGAKVVKKLGDDEVRQITATARRRHQAMGGVARPRRIPI